MRKIIRCYSPNRDIYGVLAANKNELAALSKGCRCWCWCCGPGRWCCEAERAFKTGRCHKLAVQAAYILAPASRMSTGRGILPSYLGLCWCNFVLYVVEPTSLGSPAWDVESGCCVDLKVGIGLYMRGLPVAEFPTEIVDLPTEDGPRIHRAIGTACNICSVKAPVCSRYTVMQSNAKC